jgi:WYL_2, Sm-like SH3 beta-barrel fold
MKSLTEKVLDLYDNKSEVPLVNVWPTDEAALINKLKHGVYFVTFTKSNGEVTTMECTLNGNLIPTPPENSLRYMAPTPGTIRVYSLDRGAWRSFVISRVSNFVRKQNDGE